MNKPAPLTRAEYWQRTRRLTFWLIALWFFSTFVTVFFARELAGVTLFGWPFSFYMAGQGLTLLYLLIVGIYARRMNSLDKKIRNGTPPHVK
jgi:putative solute:sodium symporter small subunit